MVSTVEAPSFGTINHWPKSSAACLVSAFRSSNQDRTILLSSSKSMASNRSSREVLGAEANHSLAGKSRHSGIGKVEEFFTKEGAEVEEYTNHSDRESSEVL